MLKQAHKVVGYFSYSLSGNVFCDGEACVISGSEISMKSYIKKMLPESNEKEIIKKTTFGEIVNGLKRGAAYALDEEACKRFLPLAKINNLGEFPEVEDFFSKQSLSDMNFMRIQINLG